MRKPLWISLALLGGLAMSLTTYTSYAEPDDITAFLGTYATKGRYSNRRKTKADISIEKLADGTLKITRTGKYTSRRHRKKPPFTWVSNDVRLDDGKLKVVFRISKKGRSLLAAANGGNLSDALTGETSPPADSEDSFDASQINVFEAEYGFDDETFREKIKNTTRNRPEHWWRRIGTKGTKLSSPEPEVEIKRIKLGHDMDVDNGQFTVILPTDGTLTLKLKGAGKIELKSPSGDVAAVSSGDTLTLDLPHGNPVLGTYTATVADLTTSTKLEARFVQDGKIDKRIRPWSSHTYYPIYEKGYGDSENQNTMFKKDGALEKFDKALKLEGKKSAIWWEKGTDYRTGFGFERGHYTKIQSPTEKKAEAEWHADLDGDGVIETEDAAGVVKRYDTDADGKVSADEAKAAFLTGVVKQFWRDYDDDGDEKVSAGEISAGFIAKYDTDASQDLSFEEWDKALRKDYSDLLEKNSKASVEKFMKKDADADGFVVKDEIGNPGSVDFQDSSDVDGDFENFFDRNNIKITTKDGKTHFGNKVTEEGDKLKLFKGRKQDELVVELKKDEVDKREDGIADGDLDDSYSVGWWGHCNAWAMASIVFRKPAAEFEKDGVKFSIRDQKGILVEYGMGETEDSTFWWQQWGGEEIPPAKYAAGFHRQMHRWLRVEQKGMMADMDMKDPNNNLNFQVWNYPLLGYTATFKEAEGDDPYVFDIKCVIEKGSYSDEDSSSTASVTYRLHFGDDGSIKEDESSKTDWTQKNYSDKREYIRYLIHPYRFLERNGSRNPMVTLKRIEEIFGENLKYNRIEDLEDEPTPDGLDGNPGQ